MPSPCAKRRKTTDGDGGVAFGELVQRFSTNPEDVISELRTCNEIVLSGDQKPGDFLESHRSFFWQTLVLFNELGSDMLQDAPKYGSLVVGAIEEALRVLRSLCSDSQPSTGSLLVTHASQCNSTCQCLARFLESGSRFPKSTKLMLLDFLCGLFLSPECARTLCAYSALIDIIAILLSSDDPDLRHASIENVVKMSQSSKRFLRALLLSNGGYHIGAFISIEKNFDNDLLLELCEALSTCDIQMFGRQMKSSPAVAQLEELLFEESTAEGTKKWQKWLIRLLTKAPDLRDGFGVSVIERVVQAFDGADIKLQYLCTCAQDAWGRIALRQTGGLRVIMDSCGNTFDAKTTLVANAFRHFTHDTEGLAVICRHEEFITKLLHLLRVYSGVGPHGVVEACHCQASASGPENAVPANHNEEFMKYTNFNGDWARVQLTMLRESDRVRVRGALSPKRTSPSPPHSLSSNDSSEWGGSSGSPSGIVDNQQLQQPRTESVRTKRKGDSVGPNLVDILDWLTHRNENHAILLKRPVVEALIDVIAGPVSSSAVTRASNATKRLFRSEQWRSLVFHHKIHVLIHKKLIQRKSLILRYGRPCEECQWKRQLGRDIITELSLQADSVIGWKVFCDAFKSEDVNTRITAMAAAITFIRDERRKGIIFYEVDAINVLLQHLSLLFDKVQSKMSPNLKGDERDQRKFRRLKNYSNILEQILLAFSSLISLRMQQTLMSPTATSFFIGKSIEECCSKPCRLADDDESEKVYFYENDEDEEPFISVDAKKLCQKSSYFDKLLRGDFRERLQGKTRFRFDPYGLPITKEHFVTFLHLLSGCVQSPCVEVESPAACAALLMLADRYLVNSLTERLLKENGVAEHLLTGAGLPDFAMVICSVFESHGRFSDLFFLILLRYSSLDEIYTTFVMVMSLRSAPVFFRCLGAFLRHNVDTLPVAPHSLGILL